MPDIKEQWDKFKEAVARKYGDDPLAPEAGELHIMYQGWLLHEFNTASPGWTPQLGEEVLVTTYGVGRVQSIDDGTIRVRAYATGIAQDFYSEDVKPWRKS